MKSLGEDYPNQQARCREVLNQYREVGPVGAFGAAMIELTLKEADEAALAGDLVRMIAAYKAMVEIK